MQDTDIVIVGAGAAGIGAGLELAESGLTCVILEAADRVGGRAFTDATSLGVPWDHGCHWLHCASENPLVAWADRLGARYRKADADEDFTYWRHGRFADAAERSAAGQAMEDADEAIDRAGAAGRDVALTEVIDRTGPHAPAVYCVLQLLTGGDPEDVSTLAYWDYEDTDEDWPVLSGYGALVAGMAQGLPIRTGVRVDAIRQRADGATVETSAGTLRAKGVIVTASTNVLTSGAIAFDAGPARDLLDDIAQVPCGVFEKVALELPALPPETQGRQFCIADPGDGRLATEFTMIAGTPALAVANFAGSWARELAAEGPGALEAFARERLALVFGADLARTVRGASVTGWHGDPFVQGSYSHARPGAARVRHRMIEADTGRVAFAGEAFSMDWQATAHGAYVSGREVARRMAKRIRRGR